MKVLLILSFLIISFVRILASVPGPAYPLDIWSQNGSFYLHAVPYENYDVTRLGKTKIFNSKTKKLLYTIDQYISTGSFITNSGRTVIDVEYMLFDRTDSIAYEPIMTFFLDGKKIKTQNITNVYSESFTLIRYENWSVWNKGIFIFNDTLYILTFDEQAVVLNAKNGDFITVKNVEELANKFNLKKTPSLRQKQYRNIQYPPYYMLPPFNNGKNSHDALVNHLNAREVDSDSCKWAVYVGILLDRRGKAEVLDVSSSRKEGEPEDSVLNSAIKTWLEEKTFRINLIPGEADKWVFRDYFYLNEL